MIIIIKKKSFKNYGQEFLYLHGKTSNSKLQYYLATVKPMHEDLNLSHEGIRQPAMSLYDFEIINFNLHSRFD